MSEISERIKELFIEIQECMKLHRSLLDYEKTTAWYAAVKAIEDKQGELENELLELTGLQIGDFDFHVD